jgi:hypothetical protein
MSAGSLALVIEGVGGAATAGGAYPGCWRWTWGAAAPSWDSGALYRGGLTGYPSQVETSVDLLGGRATQGALRVRLAQSAPVLAALHTLTPARAALATEAVTASATQVKLNAAGLAASVIHWGREAIRLGSESTSGGVTTYSGCTRGHLATTAAAHDPVTDPEVFGEIASQTLSGRLAYLLWVPEGATSYAGEVALYTGALREVHYAGAELEVELATALDLIEGARLCQSPWVATGGYGPRDIAYRLPAAGDSSDRRATVRAGDALVIAPWRLLGGGAAAQVSISRGLRVPGSPGVPADLAADTTLREVILVAAGAPPLSSGVTLSTDLGELVVQLLTGAGGVAELPAVLPAALVDSDQIQAAARAVGARVEELVIGLDGPEPLADLLARLLAPWGLALVPGAAGKLQLASYAESVAYGDARAQINASDIHTIGAVGRRRLPSVGDRAVVTYGGDGARLLPGGPPTLTAEGAYARARAPLGSPGASLEVDAGALRDPGLAAALGAALVARLHIAAPEIEIGVDPSTAPALGAVVEVTHPALPGDGASGVTAARALVTGRRDSYRAGEQGGAVARLRLQMVGLARRRAGWLAPVCEVVSWNGGTNTLTVTSYHADPDALPASDWAALEVGDALQLCAADWSLRSRPLVIAALPGAGQIVLSGAPAATPAAGDLVRVDVYAGATAAQIARWAWLSDDDGELSSDPALAYTWEG